MRHEDWLERLNAYFDEVYDKPFKWGKYDCCLFAASCVEVMTGFDYMKDERGTYKTEKGAKKALKGKTLFANLRAKLGKPIPLAMAQRGDVIYHVFDTGPAVGICIGQETFFVGREVKEGLVTIPTLECSKAFKI